MLQLKTDYSNLCNQIQHLFSDCSFRIIRLHKIGRGGATINAAGKPREIWLSPHLRDGNSYYWTGLFQQVCRCWQIRLPVIILPPSQLLGFIPEQDLCFAPLPVGFVHFPSVLSLLTSVWCLYPSLAAARALLDAPHRHFLLSYPSGRALKSTANGQIAYSGMLTYNPHASLFHVQTRMQSSFRFRCLSVWWSC